MLEMRVAPRVGGVILGPVERERKGKKAKKK